MIPRAHHVRLFPEDDVPGDPFDERVVDNRLRERRPIVSVPGRFFKNVPRDALGVVVDVLCLMRDHVE